MKRYFVVLVAVLVSGCASAPPGVNMSEDERKSCAAVADAATEDRCTVWTVPEPRDFAKSFFLRGYQAGRKSL